MPKELELTLAIADYDRTRPLLDGRVSTSGLKLLPRAGVRGDACLRPLYEQFDIVEMDIAWYLAARLEGEPVVALPIFPQRMFVQAYLFCSASSDIRRPDDLRGKKIGIAHYASIAALWVRGILQEHYGVSPKDMTWFTEHTLRDTYQIPHEVKVVECGRNLEALLLDGEIDALIRPTTPNSFRSGDKRIRRVFGDCKRAITDYFLKTGIFPITHIVVVREALVREFPWLAGRILEMFMEADKLCRQSYEYEKRLSFPTAAVILEEEQKIFGKDPWAHGVAANKMVIEKFLEYAEDQGYIRSRPDLDFLFAPVENERSCDPLSPEGESRQLSELIKTPA